VAALVLLTLTSLGAAWWARRAEVLAQRQKTIALDAIFQRTYETVDQLIDVAGTSKALGGTVCRSSLGLVPRPNLPVPVIFEPFLALSQVPGMELDRITLSQGFASCIPESGFDAAQTPHHARNSRFFGRASNQNPSANRPIHAAASQPMMPS
jgi:hypothetical protein